MRRTASIILCLAGMFLMIAQDLHGQDTSIYSQALPEFLNLPKKRDNRSYVQAYKGDSLMYDSKKYTSLDAHWYGTDIDKIVVEHYEYKALVEKTKFIRVSEHEWIKKVQDKKDVQLRMTDQWSANDTTEVYDPDNYDLTLVVRRYFKCVESTK